MFIESYERKLQGNNLILTESNLNEADYDEFEEKMITQNSIKGFLKCHTLSDKDSKRFCYDITSLQSLEYLFEERELKRNDVERIIIGLISLKDILEEYLLSDENVILNPKHIYVDPETKIPSFVYYPYYKKPIKDSLLELGTFFLKRTNHSDDVAVRLVYGFYKNVSNENYDFEGLLNKEDKLIAKPDKEETVNNTADINQEINNDQNSSAFSSCYEENKEGRRLEAIGLLISTITLIVLIILVLLVRFLDLSNYIPVSNKAFLLICAFLGAASVTAVVSILVSRIREEKTRESLHFLEMEIDKKNETLYKNKQKRTSYFGKTDRLSEDDYNVSKRLVNYGKDKVTEFVIDHTPFILGKDRESVDGCLNNPSASRLHARITLKKNEYYITDLNSTNGTSVNGRMLTANETVIIRENDEIALAGMVFYFR